MCFFIMCIMTVVIVVIVVLTNTAGDKQEKRLQEIEKRDREIEERLKTKHYYENMYYYEVFSEIPPATGDYCSFILVECVKRNPRSTYKRCYSKCENVGTQKCVYCVRRGQESQINMVDNSFVGYKFGSSGQCREVVDVDMSDDY